MKESALSHLSSSGVFSPCLCDHSVDSQRVDSKIGFTTVRYFLSPFSGSTGELQCVFIKSSYSDWLRSNHQIDAAEEKAVHH